MIEMIAAKPQYTGRCMLCKEVISKAQMTRHLKKCVEMSTQDAGQVMKLFHLVIEDRYLPMYWLHIEIPGAMTLRHLDSFLREIWLECCGHLSCFTIDGERYAVSPDDDPWSGLREKSMQPKIYSVLAPGTKFDHEYDYGSTTDLKLRVAGVRECAVKKSEIKLLARNEPPIWKCSECGKPATWTKAFGWGDEGTYCDDCAEDEDEECLLPVVNSPRMGVCGYVG
ncbi:MAG: plasmid pRiA4b ORF-3 family protein [Verrucomicrobia bacterium]|nr:plasmid pRiA4b ORF-3 family protein [Verrucomicrobiota bacterium]